MKTRTRLMIACGSALVLGAACREVPYDVGAGSLVNPNNGGTGGSLDLGQGAAGPTKGAGASTVVTPYQGSGGAGAVTGSGASGAVTGSGGAGAVTGSGGAGGDGGAGNVGGPGNNAGGAGASTAGGNGGTSNPGSGGSSAGGGAPPSDNGLIGYWKFEEGAGTSSADSSGNNNNATLVKGTTPTAAANPSPKWVAGKNGMAVEFNMEAPNAADEWANVPRSDSLDSTGTNGAWTIAGWAKFEAITNCAICGAKTMIWNWVASRHIPGTGNEYMGIGVLDGKLSASVNFTFVSSPTPIVVGAGSDWVHVAATYDGITLTVYQSGKFIAQAAVGYPISADISQFVIGGNENDVSGVNAVKEFMGGAIDELRLYNVALSADEIAALAR